MSSLVEDNNQTQDLLLQIDKKQLSDSELEQRKEMIKQQREAILRANSDGPEKDEEDVENIEKVQKEKQSYYIPLKAKILLGPIDKYRLYNRFPWKMILHILLVAATSLQIFTDLNTNGSYSRQQQYMWYQMFLDPDQDYMDVDFSKENVFFNSEELRDFMISSLDSYFGLQDSLQTFQNYNIDDFVLLQVTYIDAQLAYQESDQFTPLFNLTQTELGPLESQSTFEKFLHQVELMDAQYNIEAELPRHAPQDCLAYQWNVNQRYDLQSQSLVKLNLDFVRSQVYRGRDEFNLLVWIKYIILVASFASFMLNLKYYTDITRLFGKLNVQYNIVTDQDQEKKFQQHKDRYEKQRIKNQQYISRIERQTSQITESKMRASSMDSYNQLFGASRKSSLNSPNPNSSPARQNLRMTDTDITNRQTGNFGNASAFSPKENRPSDSSNQNPFISAEQFEDEARQHERRQPSVWGSQNNYQNIRRGSMMTYQQEQQTRHEATTKKSFMQAYREEKSLRQEVQWKSLTWSQKAQLVNYWTVVIMLANLIQGLLTSFELTQAQFTMDAQEFVRGLCCFMLWVSMLKYLQYIQSYTYVTSTLITSLSLLGTTIVGMIPLFFGLVFLTMCVFDLSFRFSRTDRAMFTLFATWNGDMVFDTYHDTSQIALIFAILYNYSFVFYAYVVIQNVLLAQVEDAYLSIKYKSKFDWLTKDLRDPEQQTTVYEDDAEEANGQGPKSSLIEPIEINDQYQQGEAGQQMKISEFLSYEREAHEAQQLRSKRALQNILQAEEDQYINSELRNSQKMTISKLLTQKITLKLTFQAYEIDKIYSKLENTSKRKWIINDKTNTKKKIRRDLNKVLNLAQELLDLIGPADQNDNDDFDTNKMAVKFLNDNDQFQPKKDDENGLLQSDQQQK